jgi:hypothetical protein
MRTKAQCDKQTSLQPWPRTWKHTKNQNLAHAGQVDNIGYWLRWACLKFPCICLTHLGYYIVCVYVCVCVCSLTCNFLVIFVSLKNQGRYSHPIVWDNAGNASSHTKLTTGLPPLAIQRLGFWLWEETHHYEHYNTHIDRLPTFPFIGWTTFHLDSILHNLKTNQNPGQLILGLLETFFFHPLAKTQHNTIPKQTKKSSHSVFSASLVKTNPTAALCVCVCVCVRRE